LRKHFRAGRWLDLLSAYDALLLRQLKDDSRFTARCALDHQLDPTLDRHGIRSVARYLEGSLPFKTTSSRT
jgi:hypothetical protein